MKKLFLTLICFTCSTLIKAQVETYSNYPFNGYSYNAVVVKIDSETVKKFDILQNDNGILHDAFLTNLFNSDSSFFLINACISDTTCKPVGYFAKDAQEIQPANLNDGTGNFFLKPNGALLFTQDDVILCESSQISNYQNVRLGIQSGPMLLNNGSINPQFNQNSQNKNIRCGVGIFTNSKNEKFLAFGISNYPVSFYDFAVFFDKKFKCTNALCLESGECKMYFPYQSNLGGGELSGYICNYLYFKL